MQKFWSDFVTWFFEEFCWEFELEREREERMSVEFVEGANGM